jgi:hypothetical protein
MAYHKRTVLEGRDIGQLGLMDASLSKTFAAFGVVYYKSVQNRAITTEKAFKSPDEE